MPYFQIVSEDFTGSIFTDEISTNLPFCVLWLKVGDILPEDEIFPERKIIKIISDNDQINNKLAQVFGRKTRFA